MVLTYPAVLLALVLLPLLWWLLRATPPAPRVQSFPAIRLLAGLRPREETPARTPWWLLALRMLAAALVVLGLARPVLDADRATLPGTGPVLLVLDDGWDTAADWPARIAAAQSALDRAGRAGRPVSLLTTARDEADVAPRPLAAMQAASLAPRLAALRPKPWPVDRAADAAALSGVQAGAVQYIAAPLVQPGDAAFQAALAAAGPVGETSAMPAAARLLLPPRAEADRLVVRLASLPLPVPADTAVLAETGDGRVLARVPLSLAAGATGAEAPVQLPLELRNQLTRLVLEGPPSAAGVVLLDERFRRRPVGLATGEAAADTPLTGALYYLDRALAPTAELRRGTVAALLARPISVLVLADDTLAPDDRAAVTRWVEAGGLLLRFAGPRVAEDAGEARSEAGDPAATASDPLLPVPLLAGDRQLGGAMSWSTPEGLAPFPADSPFAGLRVPPEVSVTRQVLAQPSASLAVHSWARLTDGTPLVTEAARGRGRIVLFHVTANADWSSLPLSGLFVDMLARLVQLSAGVAGTPDDSVLAPAETLDGFGTLGPPPPAARGIAGTGLAATIASPQHPPGLYGPEADRRALTLSAALPPLRAAATVPGAATAPLATAAREQPVGPWLIAAALALLALDMLLGLRLRGLLRPAATMAVLLALAAAPAHAASPAGGPVPAADAAALATHLAYVLTGDATVDETSRSGLAGLSDYVNARTAAVLADPRGVTPGTDELAFYPVLYWPITAGAALGAAGTAALNDYMARGGLVLIDTQGGGDGEPGSGAGFAPDAAAALRRVTAGLSVPPLMPLTGEHVLSRSFYLLSDYPGRFDGAPVWVARDQDRSNDSVSPVVIGASDWAGAWATDAQGRNPYATIPGGDRQRTLAYRFGVNVVMYALTGNYKGDQVHVPAILERLGQ